MERHGFDRTDATFRRYLADGKFMIQRSASTGRAVFPPRLMLPGVGTQDLEWVPAIGRGTVHSFTVVARKPPLSGYNVCMVDLEEGPRLTTRLVDGDDDRIAIGMPVEAVIEAGGETPPTLAFRPAAT